MAVITEYIDVATRGNRDMVDLTHGIQQAVVKHKISDGIVVVFVPGSTAAVTTIEYEPGLKKDIEQFLEKILPYTGSYHHHETWHDDNGAAHIQAALLGPSLTVPVVNGALTLGTWQQVVLIDCDTRARKRQVVLQILY
jgi:secondary thiamine-phosphate synthase enzyme